MVSKPRIFISYARCDGKDTALEIRDRLQNEHNLTLWHDLADMEGGRDWWPQITEAIDQVEHVVLVVTPKALEPSSIVPREWRYARLRGRSVTPVMGDSDLSFDDLPSWMRRHSFVEWWESEAWDRFVIRLKGEGKIQRVPFMVDDLPENFVRRPNELEELVATLCDENRTEPVAITAALRGAGGYGKTTLARATCHDEAVQDAFFDGVLWVTLGEDPGELTGRVIDLIHTLSGKREAFETTDATINRFKELLTDRHLLLVIDDVWNHAHLRPFMEGGPNCARLITTRFATVIPEGSRQTHVDAMKVDEAIDLLRSNAPPEAIDPLRRLAQRLGEWPLLLKLAGAMLRRREGMGQNLDDALLWVNRALDKRGVTAFDARDAEQRDQAVSKTLDVSLDQLDDEERRLFADLAVFPEDVDIPLATLEVLWDLDDFETEEHCQHFFESGLLWSLDLITRHLRLHDVIRAYLRPPDIDLKSLDAKLVDAYRARCEGVWHSIPDDGYMLDWLPWHLLGAGKHDELGELVFDLNWLERKLAARGVNALIADTLLIRDDDEIYQLGRTLRMSAHVINRQPTQLTAQLIGRLHQDGGERTGRLIKQAETLIPCDVLTPAEGRHLLPPGALAQTLQGHSGLVNGAVLLDDGKRALSWSYDTTLRLWDLDKGESQPLEGHSDRVNGAVLLDDGKRALSWSYDTTLRLWDLEKGQSQPLEGHGRSVEGAVVLDDGKRALSWSYDETLRLWDLDNGQSQPLKGHSGWVNGAVISDDGKRALSWSEDTTLRLWNLDNGQSQPLEGHIDSVKSAVLLDDGKRALSWASDNTLRLWDLDKGQSHPLEEHGRSVNGAVISDDGKRALSWSYDGTLRLWDLDKGKSQPLKGHSGWVKGAVISDDGKRALSWSDDRTLRLWDLDKGKSQPLEGHIDSVKGAVLLDDGKRALSWDYDKALRLWDLDKGQGQPLEGHSGSVVSAVLLDDGKRALSWASDNTLRLWDLDKGKSQPLEGHGRSVEGAMVSDDGKRALSWSDDRTLRLWNLDKGKSRPLEGHSGWVRGAVLLDDGKRALSWASDNTLRLWDLDKGKSRPLEGHSGWVRGAVLLDDGKRALSWSEDSTLRLWDLDKGQSQPLEGHGRSVKGAVLLDDGKRALSWSEDSTLRLWDLDKGKSQSLDRHDHWVKGAVLLDDGKRALSWSDDTTLRLWDPDKGQSQPLEGHGRSVKGAVLLDDGKRALSWAYDEDLRLWDLDKGKSQPLEGHSSSVNGAVISDDGKRALSWSDDRTLRLWDLDNGQSQPLEGHIDSVKGAVLLDDGKRALSWSEDSTLRLWDLENFSEVQCFVGDDPLTTCVLSDDERLAVVGDKRGRMMRFALPAR